MASTAPVSCLPATVASICWFEKCFLALDKWWIFWFEWREEESQWWQWWVEYVLKTVIPKLRPMGAIWFTWRSKWAFDFVFCWRSIFSLPDFLRIFRIACKRVDHVFSNSCPSCRRTTCNFYQFVSLEYFRNDGVQSFNGRVVEILVIKNVLNIILQSGAEFELWRITFTFKRVVVVHCPFFEVSLYFWSILFCIVWNVLLKWLNIKLKLSADCKVTSSWRFLLGLACGGITVDSATDSYSDVVSFSLSEKSSSRISGSCSGVGSLVFFFLFFVCFIVSSLSFWALLAFLLSKFLNFLNMIVV